MKFRILVITSLLAALLSAPAFGQDRRDGPGPVAVLKKTLQLDEQQTMDLVELIKGRSQANKAVKDELHIVQLELDEAINADAPDTALIGELVLERKALQAQVGENEQAFQDGFDALLTEEQHMRVGQINRIAASLRAAEALRELRVH